MFLTKTFTVFFACLFLLSCSETKLPFAPNVSSKVIEPAYRLLQEQTAVFAKVAAESCTDATINQQELKKLRHEWLIAMSSWQQAQVFRFAPIDEAGLLRQQYQFWPDANYEIDIAVNGLLSQEQPLTAAVINSATIPAQGFSALEYLLFDKYNKLESFARPGLAASQRCIYLTHVTQRLATDSAQLASAWLPARKGFETSAPADAAAYLLNAVVSELEWIKTEKTGKPLGINTASKKPDIYITEAWRSRGSLVLIRANFFVIEKILDHPQAGLLSLLAADKTRQPLVKKIRQQMAAINHVLQRINISMNESLKSENGIAALSELYQAIDALLTSCKTELTLALSVPAR